MLIVGIAVGFFSRPRPQGRGMVVCISVGQGDCTLVESNGRAALIDVGPDHDGVDAGKTIIVPFLRKLGITHVDWIWLSHPDEDHIGGLGSVLRAYPSAKVVAPICFKDFPKMDLSLIKMGVNLQNVDWTSGADGILGAFKIQIRCPHWQAPEDDNLGSMFIHIADGKATYTTSGDAPMQTELEMIPKLDWRAEVLHLGHHGSKFSTSVAWLRAVQPQIAVASCGLNNPYGHPHKATLKRVKEYGAKLYRTDLDGSLFFVDEGNGFEKEPGI